MMRPLAHCRRHRRRTTTPSPSSPPGARRHGTNAASLAAGNRRGGEAGRDHQRCRDQAMHGAPFVFPARRVRECHPDFAGGALVRPSRRSDTALDLDLPASGGGARVPSRSAAHLCQLIVSAGDGRAALSPRPLLLAAARGEP